jgi:hypothetical protein
MRTIHRTFLTNPGFTGWKRRLCSICGETHPARCDIVSDPEWIEAVREYEQGQNELDQTVR